MGFHFFAHFWLRGVSETPKRVASPFFPPFSLSPLTIYFNHTRRCRSLTILQSTSHLVEVDLLPSLLPQLPLHPSSTTVPDASPSPQFQHPVQGNPLWLYQTMKQKTLLSNPLSTWRTTFAKLSNKILLMPPLTELFNEKDDRARYNDWRIIPTITLLEIWNSLWLRFVSFIA